MDNLAEILAGGFFGALAAYFFNVIHWFTSEKIRKFDDSVTRLISQMEQLHDISIRYWSSEYQDDLTGRIQDESVIKSLLFVYNRVITHFTSTYSDSLNSSDLHYLNASRSVIFDLVSGDSFETSAKKTDIAKCKKISSRLSKLIAIVQTSRCNVKPWFLFWANT